MSEPVGSGSRWRRALVTGASSGIGKAFAVGEVRSGLHDGPARSHPHELLRPYRARPQGTRGAVDDCWRGRPRFLTAAEKGQALCVPGRRNRWRLVTMSRYPSLPAGRATRGIREALGSARSTVANLRRR
jgi:hypothetical protein